MTKTISTILIDDELPNLVALEHKLNDLCPHIDITERYQEPEDAIKALKQHQPQLVFLDIKMPRIDGFELLEQLQHINFHVIFVTAYSSYAIEAFKQNAIDYILKPIDDDDLKIAVNKAVRIIEKQNELEQNNNLLNLLTSTLGSKNKIIVPTSKGMSFIPQDDVIHLEGDDGYTKIHLTDNSTLMSSYNLGKFEKLLNDKFYKSHKSHIVNLAHVRHFVNEGYLVLDNEKHVPISKRNKKAFLDLFR